MLFIYFSTNSFIFHTAHVLSVKLSTCENFLGIFLNETIQINVNKLLWCLCYFGAFHYDIVYSSISFFSEIINTTGDNNNIALNDWIDFHYFFLNAYLSSFPWGPLVFSTARIQVSISKPYVSILLLFLVHTFIFTVFSSPWCIFGYFRSFSSQSDNHAVEMMFVSIVLFYSFQSSSTVSLHIVSFSLVKTQIQTYLRMYLYLSMKPRDFLIRKYVCSVVARFRYHCYYVYWALHTTSIAFHAAVYLLSIMCIWLLDKHFCSTCATLPHPKTNPQLQ